MTRTFEDAVILATQAHAGQRDKVGQPYICHPLRVAERVRQGFLPEGVDRDLAMQAAVLHDVIEDTEIGMAHLVEAGYSNEVIIAVSLLTKQASDNYLDFVRRALSHPISRVVKYHDIADNSDPVRLFLLDESTRNRLIEKYNKAKALF